MVTWVLESDVFSKSHPPFRAEIIRAGHQIVEWSDSWRREKTSADKWSGPVVFHGSLSNAAFVKRYFSWSPGSFCDVDPFRCSRWYKDNHQWLVHDRYVFTTVGELVAAPEEIAASIGQFDRVFVRPDSPLKPFSGRVVNATNLTLANLDHGFYYDNLDLPVVVSPVRNIGKEWRFVIVNGVVISGSGYNPATRAAVPAQLDDQAAEFASAIAAQTDGPEDVYVLDVCQCDDQFKLVEFNPFSGADLYACDPDATIRAISEWAVNHCSVN